MTLDAIDRRILRVLQQDGRCPNNELARRVGLSPSPCLRRVRILEENGVIDGYGAVVDPGKLGYGVTAFVRIWLTGEDERQSEHFVNEIGKLSHVIEAHVLAGDCDFLLRVVAEDLSGLRRFQSECLARIKGVRSMKTDIPLLRVKKVGLP
ncbi:MAG: Lrp/AsnC family transcriptional regulator [Gluconobacter oxydans]